MFSFPHCLFHFLSLFLFVSNSIYLFFSLLFLCLFLYLFVSSKRSIVKKRTLIHYILRITLTEPSSSFHPAVLYYASITPVPNKPQPKQFYLCFLPLLFVCLSAYSPSIPLPLSKSLSLTLSLSPSFFLTLSISLCVCHSICLSIYISISLTIHLCVCSHMSDHGT